MRWIDEFKEFAVRGNVVDMAVGIIIGAAFGKITNTLVSDVIMPPIGLVVGGVDFSSLALTLREATDKTQAVQIKYGAFINTVIDFLIVAFAVFLLVKAVNTLRKQKPAEPAAPPAEIVLLTETRDALKAR